MRAAATRTICRLLIALMAWTPFQLAHAGMIGASQVADAERATVATFLSRADVARELQALGLDAATAHSRVAALSDDEARALAERISGMPAGGNVEGVVLWLIVIAVVWYIFWGQYKPRG